jgi:hypothetical protein
LTNSVDILYTTVIRTNIVILNKSGKLFFLLKLSYSNKYSSQSKFKKKLSLISSLGLPEEAFLGSKNHEQMRINVVLRTVP